MMRAESGLRGVPICGNPPVGPLRSASGAHCRGPASAL